MMVIVDIFIYVAFAFIASAIANKSEALVGDSDESAMAWDRYLVCFMLFFAVIGGLRWNVGSDCLSYAYWFKYPQIEAHNKEGLWWFLVDIIQSEGIHWSIGLGICAFAQIFFITKALKPYRWLLVFVPFVFFGGRYWLDCMGAVRQMIVACGFLWASTFIGDRKLFKYVLFVLIASLIHQSAVILLPFYFLPLKVSVVNHRWKLIAILAICFVLGQTPSFAGAIKYVQIITGATNYDGYSEVFSSLLMEGKTDEALAIGPMMLTYLAIPLLIIWYGPELNEEYSKKMPSFNIWYNLAYFYACGYFLVCNISHLFIRPMLYFSLFQMVMAALLLQYLWSNYKAHGVRQLTTYAFCLIVAINTAWDVYKASGKPFECTTYKISFFYPDQKRVFGL